MVRISWLKTRIPLWWRHNPTRCSEITRYRLISCVPCSDLAPSIYNALQASLTKRFGNGLFFSAAYTWSRVMTTATLDTTYVRADQYTRQAEYSPASFDRRQVFALNYVYNVPPVAAGNWLTHAVTNGWQLSGVTLMTTGLPFTPSF